MKAGAIVQAHAGGTVRDGEKFGIRLEVCALRSSRLRVIGFLVCDLVKPGWEPGFHGVKNQGRTALLQRLEHYHRAHLVSMKNVPGYAWHEQPVEEGAPIILISIWHYAAPHRARKVRFTSGLCYHFLRYHGACRPS